MIPEDAVLASLDVNALYTSIPHQEAYRVITNLLDTRPTPDPPTHFLLELLDLILKKNILGVRMSIVSNGKEWQWARP